MSFNVFDLDQYDTFDLSAFGVQPALFPGFEKTTRKKLFTFYIEIMNVGSFIYDWSGDWQKIFRFFLNLLQLIVLTRKALRINSTNVIFAIMSLNHIFVMVFVVLQTAASGVETSVEPRQDPLIQDVLINYFRVTVIGNVFRNVLAWLPITMAITRAIAISKPTDSKVNSQKFGVQTSFFLLLISSLIELIEFFIMTSGGLAPSKEYYQIPTTASFLYDSLTFVIQIIIPAISYPVVLLNLILKNRKAKKFASNQTNDPTTRMIIIMLIFFMIVEIPRGIGGVLSIFNGGKLGFYYIGLSVIALLDNFNMFNASIYCLICAKMTPNYKKTFFNMFRCGKQRHDQVADSAVRATTDS